MPPSLESVLDRYDDPYRKAGEIERDPDRFDAAVARGDDGAFGVGALVAADGCGLFVREGETWLLPGGRLESGETPEEGAKREVREEAGIDVDIVGLGAVAEQTFRRRGGDATYEFTFLTFVAEPSAPGGAVAVSPADPSIDGAAWLDSVPRDTFDRDLVVRLFEAYV